MLQEQTRDGEFVFVRRSALQIKTGTARVGGTIAATTARVTIPTGAKLVEVTALVDCYIMFGPSDVDATSTIGNDGTNSKLFAAGVQILEVPSPGDVLATHLAFIEAAAGDDSVIQVEVLV
jgi:hypothetical protein